METHPVRRRIIYFQGHKYNQTKMFILPSAPKSGLKDFFSLKFLKILTMLLLSLMAYLFENKKKNAAVNSEL